MAFLKLLPSRNVTYGMGKRFYGIWSKDLCQTKTMEGILDQQVAPFIGIRCVLNNQTVLGHKN
jgi:hypothetical protein